MNDPYDHRSEFLPLDNKRFFPPTYGEIRRVKIQRNWALVVAVVSTISLFLLLIAQ